MQEGEEKLNMVINRQRWNVLLRCVWEMHLLKTRMSWSGRHVKTVNISDSEPIQNIPGRRSYSKLKVVGDTRVKASGKKKMETKLPLKNILGMASMSVSNQITVSSACMLHAPTDKWKQINCKCSQWSHRSQLNIKLWCSPWDKEKWALESSIPLPFWGISEQSFKIVFIY